MHQGGTGMVRSLTPGKDWERQARQAGSQFSATVCLRGMFSRLTLKEQNRQSLTLGLQRWTSRNHYLALHSNHHSSGGNLTFASLCLCCAPSPDW